MARGTGSVAGSAARQQECFLLPRRKVCARSGNPEPFPAGGRAELAAHLPGEGWGGTRYHRQWAPLLLLPREVCGGPALPLPPARSPAPLRVPAELSRLLPAVLPGDAPGTAGQSGKGEWRAAPSSRGTKPWGLVVAWVPAAPWTEWDVGEISAWREMRQVQGLARGCDGGCGRQRAQCKPQSEVVSGGGGLGPWEGVASRPPYTPQLTCRGCGTAARGAAPGLARPPGALPGCARAQRWRYGRGGCA